MSERDTRNYKELEEFILVKDDQTPIFREIDVKVRPIAIGKNGPEFEIIDKDNNRIGIVKDDKTFQFDIQYEKELKERMGDYYNLLGFEQEILKYDVVKELQKQDERDKEVEENKKKNENKENQKENENQKNSEKENEQEESKEEEKNIPITKQELEEQIDKEITAFTMIKDDTVLEDMELSSDVDRNCVLIAEIEGKYKLLYREVGTNEIKEIEPKEYERDSTEEVTRFKDNVEYKENMATRLNVNSDNKLELSVRSEYGQIRIDRVMRQESGEIILSEIETDIGYPTEEERNRQEDERFNPDESISNESKLSENEIEEIINNSFKLNNEINEQTKENIREIAYGERETITKGRLEEIIEEEKSNTADRETAMRQRKIN